MSDSRKRILTPFTGRKNRKAWNKTREKYMPEERKQNLAETDKRSYHNQEEWSIEAPFYNGSESDDSDNDDENYNENIEAAVRRFLRNRCS